MNINSLLYDQNPPKKSFIDMTHANSIVNLINKPTWFPRGRQRGDPSILDHFYTNKPELVKNIGLLDHGIADHLPIFTTISIHPQKRSIEQINPYTRDFRNFDSEKFNESLSRFTANDSDDLDTNFHNLHIHFLKCLDNHAPLRKRTNKELKFALKPWISNSIKRSIKKRNRLQRLSRINHPNQMNRRTKYNRYKKRLEKILFAAEVKYYSNKIDACQNKSKVLWKVINEIIRRKKGSKIVLDRLRLEDGTEIENSKNMADTLNEYFVNVGPKLAEKLPTAEKSFESYLRNSPVESFVINPT